MISSLLIAFLASPPRDFGAEVLAFGRGYLGRPYVAHVLDRDPDHENLVVNERELDCMTFAELSLARARAKVSGTNFEQEVAGLRYQGGKPNGFASRRHYASSWIMNAESIHAVSVLFKGDPLAPDTTRTINYMSTHPAQYVQLAAHPEFLPGIEEQEAAISRTSFPSVAQASLPKVVGRLRPGDFVCLGTGVKGLDYAHWGMISKVSRNDAQFIHASVAKKKVVEERSLISYVEKRSQCPDLTFLRPLAP